MVYGMVEVMDFINRMHTSSSLCLRLKMEKEIFVLICQSLLHDIALISNKGFLVAPAVTFHLLDFISYRILKMKIDFFK
jgi:hypothetical protein